MDNYQEFLKIVVPRIDLLVSDWNSPHPYQYTRGRKREHLRLAYDIVSKYFTGFEDSMVYYRTSHGFAGPRCYYGSMPCLIGMSITQSAVGIQVYKGTGFGGVSDPTILLYSVTVWDAGVAVVEAHFDKVLH